MIYTRRIDAPLPTGYQLEYYDGSSYFPLGVAYVVEHPEGPTLEFVNVADQWRRRGIGEKLVREVLARWPNVIRTPPISAAGAALQRKTTNSHTVLLQCE